MNKISEGGCACREVRYQFEGEPLMTFKCHCVDCQRASGGPFATVLLVGSKNFKFTKGLPKYYSTPSTAGGVHIRGFCGNCGSRLTGGENGYPKDFIGLVVASLDDSTQYQNQMHIFVSQAQPWDVINDGLPKHDLYPPKA